MLSEIIIKKAIKADGTEITYEDKQGYWKVATLEEIRAKDYNLTPASYVGVAPIEEDGEPFKRKWKDSLVNYLQLWKNPKNLI